MLHNSCDIILPSFSYRMPPKKRAGLSWKIATAKRNELTKSEGLTKPRASC